MGNVVQLGNYRTQETVAALRELYVLASKGRIAGLAFKLELKDGTEKAGVTGKYRADPTARLLASPTK